MEKNNKVPEVKVKKSFNLFSFFLKIFMFLFIIVIGTGAYLVYTVSKETPVDLIDGYAPVSPSVIYDINGNQIDTIMVQNRSPIGIGEIPEHVQNAFLAIEDRKFRTHYGFDFIRTARAAFLTLTKTRREGGSTITQQLAKNAFLSPEQTMSRKIKEAILAVEIERKYTKDEILENYLNTIYFGQGAYGIKNAAIKYFNKQPKQLTIAQAAILASLPKSPTKYSKLENALERQKLVLHQMRSFGFISDEEYLKAIREKITFVNGNIKSRNEEEQISTSNVAPEFTTIVLSEVRKILKIPEEDQKFLFDGYKIYATVDLDLQRAAYTAFNSNYNLKSRANLNGALFSIDPSNGFVKAMVGGKNYKKGNFNRAISSLRQPGSSFKPVVYLAALQKKMTMSSVMEDSPVKIGNWKPKNYDGVFRDSMTLAKALEISNNIIPVKLLQYVGIGAAEKVWRDAGVVGGDFPKNYTLALGSISTKPSDMAMFYAALANGGYQVKPQYIYKIENKFGEIVYEAKPKMKKIYDSKDVAILTYMLENAVNYGTGQPAKVMKDGKLIPMAGKTGTTSDYVSAWFTGYTPTLATVVYVGNDDNKSMGPGMTGGAAAAPIWKNYMQAVVDLPNYNVGVFEFIDDYITRKDLTTREIDLQVGLLDRDGVNRRTALFKAGTEPIEGEGKFRRGVTF
ncbi:transglycosylase domain-containing protein [Leptotrichia sp. HSP-536]|uniref:Transglycosylase domain-containing protein n=1 Tax=Leptotrichia alba TaxID=3239304 RepID=A0AB39V1E1_9FUSO